MSGKHPNLHRGENVSVDGGVQLDAKSGPIVLGNGCHISLGVKILPDGGWVSLGEDCHVGPYTILYGHGGLEIGEGTHIGAHTVLIPANHIFSDPDKPICRQGLSKKGIVIGRKVRIGSHARILDGVSIGDGSLIEDGSVVSQSIPAGSRAEGAPAKVIGKNES